MSPYATSSPVFSLTRWFLMRAVVPFSNWWKWTSWSSVAEYSPTGTLTNPNETAPDQIALAIPASCSVASLALVKNRGRPQTARRRALEHLALRGEARTVERAVPGALGVVPAQRAAEVGADRDHPAPAAVHLGLAHRQDA